MKNTQITRLKKLFEFSLTLSGDPMEIFQHAAKMIGELLEVKIVCLSEIQGEQLNFLAVYRDGEIYSNATLYTGNVAEKVIDSLSKPYQLSSLLHYISASIGIVLFNSPEATITSVLASADTAMYQAKKSGKTLIISSIRLCSRHWNSARYWKTHCIERLPTTN